MELSERERIVVRKALDWFMEREEPRHADSRNVFCAERAIARDLSFRV